MKNFFSKLFIVIFFMGLLFGFHYLIYFFVQKQGELKVAKVEIFGNRLISNNKIIDSSGMHKGSDIFEFDLLDIAANISANPIIEYAVVKRLPPNSIEIEVQERKPIAMIADRNTTFVYDKNGNKMDIGFLANTPIITVDFGLRYNNNQITDEVVKSILKNLSNFKRSADINKITIKKKEGVYITLNKTGDTVYYIKNGLASIENLQKIVLIGDKIIEKKLNMKFISIGKTDVGQ